MGKKVVASCTNKDMETFEKMVKKVLMRLQKKVVAGDAASKEELLELRKSLMKALGV